MLAAVKLVPLGQSAGQRLLHRLPAAMPAIVERAQTLGDDAIGLSSVSQALASARHESQYTRWLRSWAVVVADTVMLDLAHAFGPHRSQGLPMPKKLSAGILLYRRRAGALQVLLVHPGGPFWARKDDGAWSIPKGEHQQGEDALDAAQREFQEETGFTLQGRFVPLTALRQPSGKIVSAWAIEGDVDPSKLRSNTFRMEWPPHSGQQQEFPEVDRGGWFGLDDARRKLLTGQLPLLSQLAQLLAEPGEPVGVAGKKLSQGSPSS